jgi:hypothetical protein
MNNPKDALTEQELDKLVELDASAQEDNAGSLVLASALISAASLVTASGYCPTWQVCSHDCTSNQLATKAQI